MSRKYNVHHVSPLRMPHELQILQWHMRVLRALEKKSLSVKIFKISLDPLLVIPQPSFLYFSIFIFYYFTIYMFYLMFLLPVDNLWLKVNQEIYPMLSRYQYISIIFIFNPQLMC